MTFPVGGGIMRRSARNYTAPMGNIWREMTKDDFGLDGEIEVATPMAKGEGFEKVRQRCIETEKSLVSLGKIDELMSSWER
ncbi:MAG TPA: hypothetical protein VN688_14195 [Gemmataceae bacterium]|nr:hypothetical protein [Gemmataceae bacterium]